MITSYLRLVSKGAVPPGLSSTTRLPAEVDIREIEGQSTATSRLQPDVRGDVKSLTVKRHLFRELRYRILDSCAAAHKHSGGVIVYAVAAWFIGFILLLAHVSGELATLGFWSR